MVVYWNAILYLPKFHLLLFKIIIFLCVIVLCAGTQLSFSFPTFNTTTKINYSLNATPTDPVIQLTTNRKDIGMYGSTGRATYFEKMQLWDKDSGKLADFNTSFSFVIDSQNSSFYADGLTFFLAPDGFSIPDALSGGGIGLVSYNQIYNSTSNPFVAVEFDTYHNEWDEQPGVHVGININSMISNKSVPWNSSIPDGKQNTATISYNSTSMNLSVVFTGFKGNTTIQQHLYYKVNLKDFLPDWVIFGFSAATGSAFEIHTINSWYFSSEIQIDKNVTTQTVPGAADPPTPDHSGPSKAGTDGPHPRRFRGLVVGLVVIACVLLGGLGLLLFGLRRKVNRVERNDDRVLNVSNEFENGMGPRKFSYKELAVATKNFMEEEKVGEGGFGAVYRGFLRELNTYVAVKRVSRGSKQGIKEFASEVKIFTRLRHRNLVQLIGWCHEKRELLLVYEFMPNGSLDSHLFKENCMLTWVMRYSIARGLASSLLYLHEGWDQCVLHRDIKSSNIMLNSSFNAKLGDFGLARLVDHEKGSQTTVLAGTIAYMAPECLVTGKASKESDVYSFGIVALEIACGRKPIDPMANKDQIKMVDWVWKLYGSGKLLEAADPRLYADFHEEQMRRLIIVGLWCAHPDYNHRPSIKQAIQLLDFEAPLPDLPLKMPLLTCLDPPVNMSAFSAATTSGYTDSKTGQTHPLSSSDSTDSSKLTTFSAASPTAALLLNTQ